MSLLTRIKDAALSAIPSGLVRPVRREVRYLTAAVRTLGRLRSVKSDAPRLATDDLEAAVDKNPDGPAFIFEGETTRYRDFEAYANQVAHWAQTQGLARGDTVALFMGNRPEYVAIWFGLSKVGVVAALLNNQLTGEGLAHCINISDARHVIVEREIAELVDSARPHFIREMTEWAFGGVYGEAENFDSHVEGQSDARPPRSVREGLLGRDTALKIYTSGTTGLPKAAKVAHIKVLVYMNAFAATFNSKSSDRMLMTLPLYHSTGGLVGIGVVLVAGGCVILERKFSASRFWDAAADHGATLFTYVGELCRYLLAAPPHPKENAHKLRGAVGNGLRPDIWKRFADRFKVPWIVEFYGSTEGNVSLINFDGHEGAIGRIPPYLAHRFNVRMVKFDYETEEPYRDANGRCVLVEPNEVGEAIGKISTDNARFAFAGYAGEKKATEKKILHDAFEEGDRWFRTGDLLRQDKLGYFYFVDRVGDTFRWKSENVSTNEVAEALGEAKGVIQANVYGVDVPGYDGRAGMAALVFEGEPDLDALHAYVRERLPHFARPVFIRVQSADSRAHTTGTFKLRKVELVREGFDPRAVADPIYFDDPSKDGYVRLGPPRYDEIVSGGVRL
ncbi:MAG: long-chain-acyl-CoA synthetase [Maricaulaceae bacterium]|jgi:fatty-acyl-CoA synthase